MDFTPLSQFLSNSNVPPSTVNDLVLATSNRAVLLLEVTDFVLTRHFKLSKPAVAEVHRVKCRIAAACHAEVDKPGKYMPVLGMSKSTKKFSETVSDLRLAHNRHMTWLEYMAAGGTMSGHHLSSVLECVFQEKQHIEICRSIGMNVFSFKDKCVASGLAHLVPAAEVDQSPGCVMGRRPLGLPPREKITAMSSGKISAEHETIVASTPWLFSGVLEAESRIRVHLSSFPKSWMAVRSAWRAWAAYQDVMHPFDCQFPATAVRVAAFCCVFDNPETLSAYLGHLRKAHLLLQLEFVVPEELSAVKRSSHKFKPKRVKSFIDWKSATRLAQAAVDDGRPDLARAVATTYTFQNRTMAELLPLEAAPLENVPDEKDVSWHSYVRHTNNSVDMVLRRRKNKDYISVVKRKCQCRNTPSICGVHALIYQLKLAREGGHKLVFWSVKAKDIECLKRYARQLSIPCPTWHGFRRGRTCDLVTCKHWGEAVSLEDIFESGGWAQGSKAVLRYLREEVVDKEHVATGLADDSDSD
jgi:hypothetical protein